MKALLQVAIGGGIGASLRYLMGLGLKPEQLDTFPTHTFIVNVLGCLAIGICAALLVKAEIHDTLQLFVITGILGGFTTFSSFSLETLYLLKAERYFMAFIYTFSSLLFGVLAAGFGFLLPKWIL